MEYIGQTITGGTIRLDGARIVDCTIKNATLEYAGGALPVMERNRVDDCRFTYVDAAARTVEFLQFLYRQQGGAFIADTLFPFIALPK